ncbi:MAG TPA: hypothetical protein VFQ15_08800 [Jiangellaceae bacterium]|nr:hypothetical protein [Jiangellaceae bacterium]
MTAEEQYAEIVRDAAIATVDAQRDHAALVDRYADHHNPVAGSAYTAGVKEIIDRLAVTATELGERMRVILEHMGATGCSVTVGYPWGIQVSVSWDRPGGGYENSSAGQHVGRRTDVPQS